MANPFDQFDQPQQGAGSNPFDQFDTPTQTATPSQPVDDSWSNKLSRAGYGAVSGPLAIAQLGANLTGYGKETTNEWANQLAQKEANAKAQAGLKPDDTDWWHLGGELLPAVAVPELGIASKLGLGAKTVAGIAGRGAIGGAGFGLATPVTGQEQQDFANTKLSQGATGALLGGGTGAALGTVAKAAKPAIDEAVQKFIGEGGRPSVGQMFPESWFNRAEQSAQSYPFAGQFVRGTRKTAYDDFQTIQANRALSHIGEEVSPGITKGPALVEDTFDKISNEYNRIHPNVSLTRDAVYDTKNADILKDATDNVLPKPQLDILQTIIDKQNERLAGLGGTAPGKTVQRITSELGRKSKGYITDPSLDVRDLGRYIGQVRANVADALMRQNPASAPELAKANAAWGEFADMLNAAGRRGGELGEFSPAQLEAAAKRGAPALEKAGVNVATKNPSLEWAGIGRKVLGNTVPDSGSPERAALMMAYHNILGTGGHYAAHAALGPWSLAPGLALAAVYNPATQAALRYAIQNGALMHGPSSQALRNIIEKYAPTVAGRLPILTNGNQ